VYQKLQLARLLLQEKKLTKSGKNKFAGYDYFELQDFLPVVQTIFADTGLCAVFRCGVSDATLTVYNTANPEDYVLFTAPMAAAELKGCHPVQNLGASISYLRRYLYVNALEIVEHDELDAVTGAEEEKPKAAPKPAPKASESKPAPNKETIEGKPGDWQMIVSGTPGDSDWMEVIEDAANKLLDFAKSEEDVMAIYKKNKQLFEEVKAQDTAFFKDLMDKFSTARNKFKEAA
jgi:hypothetical protein